VKQERKLQKNSGQTNIKKTEKVQLQNNISPNKIILWVVLISIATLFAYSSSFKNEITNWDDDNYIVKNPWLKEISGENMKSIFTEYYMGNYHPLAMLSLTIDYQIGGVDKKGEIEPWIYHFTNFFLHLLNTLLVFWLAYLLLGRFEIAVLTGFLFGLSTLHVESVAWISERKDVLYALFFIASLISYVYYIKHNKSKYYIFSFVLFVLSLFSKGQAVSLAVSLIAIDFLFGRKLLDKKIIIEKIPYFLLAIIFGFIAIKAQQAGNALHDADSYEFYKRIGFAGYAFTQYLYKLLIPTGLSAIYPYPDIINRSIPSIYWLFMIPALLVVYAFFYYLKRSKIISFCIAFFIINIFLLLQLIPVGSAILADRYSYIPSIGYYLLMAYLLIQLVNRFQTQKTIIYGLTGVYLVAIGIASFNRSKVWEKSLTLWDDTIEKSPQAVVAWNNRGSIKDRDKKHDQAIEDFTRAIVIKPDYTHAFYNRGTSKKDWAKELNDSSLLKSAIQDFDKALEFDKNFLEAFHNRGLAKENLSDFAKTELQRNSLLNSALDDYNKTIDLDPKYENALVNRGVIKGKMGKLDEAIEDFNKAIEMKPDNASAFSNRGLAKDNKGDLLGAIADYNLAIEKDPEFVTGYLNRGIVYRKMKNYQASILDFSKAIELDEKLAAAYYFRGLDQILIEKKVEGCNDLQMAVNLGNPYAQQQMQIYCNK